MRESNIFNERERRLLYEKKPELRPAKVPSLKDAKTMRVPSLNDVVLLEKPSVDQIIIEFLKQYEVNVKPRSVGVWNGWDTLSTLSVLFAREGSTLNISSTMFMANRSNQVNTAAQDWGTWKRWALDHKNFEQYKEDVIQTIDLHNENLIKEVEERIRKAKLHNKNAIEDIKKSIREKELYNSNLAKKLQDPELKDYVSKLVESENLQIEKQRKNSRSRLNKLMVSLISITLLFIGFRYITRPQLSRENRQLILYSNNQDALEAKLSFVEGEKAYNSKNYRIAKYWFERTLKLDKNLKGVDYAYGLTLYKLAMSRDLGAGSFVCPAVNNLEKVKSSDPNFNKANELLTKIERAWTFRC